ncbi:hypothetical protein M0R45_026191 [Rubus argutus]|uniref:MHC class I antigen n=1 Tax=Rubus argutus TaxID=59490 RepID=A0AAW1WZE1_RUBAR
MVATRRQIVAGLFGEIDGDRARAQNRNGDDGGIVIGAVQTATTWRGREIDGWAEMVAATENEACLRARLEATR